MCDVSKIIDDAEKLADTTEKSVGVIEKLLNTNPDHRAKMLYMKEIENDPTLTKTEKMEALFAYGTIKKQMKNIASTYTLADIKLKEKGKSIEEEVPKLDVDWVNYYNDVVKNFSNEDMQVIWARILAEECEKHGSIGKKLLSILQVISKAEAEAFAYICSHLVIFKCDDNNNDLFDRFFIWPERSLRSGKKLCNYYNDSIIDDFAIMNLSGLGLVDYNIAGFFLCKPKITINSFDEEFTIQTNDPDGVPSGLVAFTSPGIELVQVLQNDLELDKSSNYADLIKAYYIEKRCEVITPEKKN